MNYQLLERLVFTVLQAIGIPTFLTGMSRGLLGKQNPIHMRYNRKDALKEADLIILAGALVLFFKLNQFA